MSKWLEVEVREEPGEAAVPIGLLPAGGDGQSLLSGCSPEGVYIAWMVLLYRSRGCNGWIVVIRDPPLHRVIP